MLNRLYLANLLCHKSRNSGKNGLQSIWLSPAMNKRLNIEPSQLKLISGKVAQWIDKSSKEFSFQ
jgi:hypothetical protein